MAGVQRRRSIAATSCRDCDSAHHLNGSQPRSMPVPCWREDVIGVHPGVAVHFLMLRMLPYASLGLERRGDLDVAVTRR
jgi:hypothetical protein